MPAKDRLPVPLQAPQGDFIILQRGRLDRYENIYCGAFVF